MGRISGTKEARRRKARDVSISSRTTSAGRSRGANQVWRMVNAACEWVMVVRPGLVEIASAKAESGNAFHGIVQVYGEPEVAQNFDGIDPGFEGAVLAAE